MGCLYLEIEGQSYSVDNVDRGLMKNDQLGHMTKEHEKYYFNQFFPTATVLGIFRRAIPKPSLEKIMVKLSAFR